MNWSPVTGSSAAVPRGGDPRLPGGRGEKVRADTERRFRDDFAPYGTAKVDMHEYPTIHAVFDVDYNDPNELNILCNFVRNTAKPLKSKMMVVTHGPELRAFAKENYEKYHGIVKMGELAEAGVEFRTCNNAMRAAGCEAKEMHGFITVVSAGFPEIAYLQSQGYQRLNPLPLPVKDVRYLDQPRLRK